MREAKLGLEEGMSEGTDGAIDTALRVEVRDSGGEMLGCDDAGVAIDTGSAGKVGKEIAVVAAGGRDTSVVETGAADSLVMAGQESLTVMADQEASVVVVVPEW